MHLLKYAFFPFTLAQYIAGTENTVPWEQAPVAVEAARKLINDRMKLAINMDYHFNEVLSAGYMEKQKMAVCSSCLRNLLETDFRPVS